MSPSNAQLYNNYLVLASICSHNYGLSFTGPPKTKNPPPVAILVAAFAKVKLKLSLTGNVEGWPA
jgi:hypothetical protein